LARSVSSAETASIGETDWGVRVFRAIPKS
jgi:hypothetical protein